MFYQNNQCYEKFNFEYSQSIESEKNDFIFPRCGMSNCMEEFFKHFEIEANVVERISRFADTIRTRSKLNSTMNVLDFGCERGLVGLSLIKESKKMTFLDPSKPAIE